MAGRGAISLLPEWSAVIWTLLFLVVIVLHLRDLGKPPPARRLWHAGHVLMGIGMLFMFVTTSLDPLGIPAWFWQLTFASAGGIVLGGMIGLLAGGEPISAFWALMTTDLLAMVYMWSPTCFVAPITWLFVAYYLMLSVTWLSSGYQRVDERAIGGSTVLSNGGRAARRSQVGAAIVCRRNLRAAKVVMALGMAYMFAAMQLAM